MSLIEAMIKYRDMFGSNFPSYQLRRGKDDSEIIELIQSCLKEEKDVYEMGYLKEDPDVEY